jgi:hypothetical protein
MLPFHRVLDVCEPVPQQDGPLTTFKVSEEGVPHTPAEFGQLYVTAQLPEFKVTCADPPVVVIPPNPQRAPEVKEQGGVAPVEDHTRVAGTPGQVGLLANTTEKELVEKPNTKPTSKKYFRNFIYH